jgi:membrane-bound metal-dependent hydrolase YbcI (DUF457 family)
VLGRDHALSGALIFAALAPEMHVTGGYLATGVVLSAGAGVLPDIDHPDSSMALSFGFLTNSFSWLVEHVSGGHRHLTHAILGVTLFTAGALAAGRYQLAGPHATLSHLAFSWHLVPAGLFITLLYASALRALKVGGHHADLIAIAGAAATVYTGADLIQLTQWHIPLIGLATVLGCAAHIAGDELTHAGCPLLYPVSEHEFHLLPRPLEITTAKIAETYVIFPIVAIALGMALWHATGHRL